jgi:hypothetical protein
MPTWLYILALIIGILMVVITLSFERTTHLRGTFIDRKGQRNSYESHAEGHWLGFWGKCGLLLTALSALALFFK